MKKFFVCFIVLILTLNCSIFAMTPTYSNNAKFSRGVSNCCYYVDSTASGYTSQVNSAANNWEVTGYGWNPIYMTAVSSNYATHMDFYSRTPSTDTYLNDTVLGYTSFWTTNGVLVANKMKSPTSNYFYTEIVFNSSLSDSYDYRTAKHEMGHAFGLAHTENSYSIMFPSLNDTYVSTVQQCDHDTINYLYN
jgi:predicted Zn-dependent protease